MLKFDIFHRFFGKDRDFSSINRNFPLQVCGFLPIFAVEKKRKGLSMTTLLSIIAAIAIGLGVGLMSKQEPEKKPWKRKKNFFVRMGEGDVTYPGYTVHND